MLASFGCNEGHNHPSHEDIKSFHRSVRGVLSHGCLRKANWEIGVVTGFKPFRELLLGEEDGAGPAHVYANTRCFSGQSCTITVVFHYTTKHALWMNQIEM